MPHFVKEPPPVNYWVPEINLTLPIDATGRATVNAWCPALKFEDVRISLKGGEDYRIKAYNNQYNKAMVKDLLYFEVDGLRGGDMIAVVAKSGGQLTDWLPIQGVLPSVASPVKNIAIEPMAANINSQAWVKDTIDALKTIAANPVGALLIDALPSTVTIFYDHYDLDGYGSGRRGSTIKVTRDDYPGHEKEPGHRYDEVLIHELAHFADGGCSTYKDVGDGLVLETNDFFSVTVTNVYSSFSKGRQLRRSFKGFEKILDKYEGSAGAANFNAAQKANLKKVSDANPGMYQKLILVKADWNPFR